MANIINLMNRQAEMEWRSNVSTAAEESPDDAARALDLAEDTRVPAGAIYENLEDAEQQRKVSLSHQIVGADDFLQQYVRSHPLAAKISSDDWGNLSQASDKLQVLNRSNPFQSMVERGWEEAKEKVDEERQHLVERGPTPMVTDAFRKDHPEIAAYVDRMMAHPVPYTLAHGAEALGDTLSLGMQGVLGFVHGMTAEAATKAGVPRPEQFARDIAGEMERQMVQGHEAVEPTFRQAQDVRFKQAADAVKPFLDAGEMPPRGLHPMVDDVYKIFDKLDDKNFNEALKALNKTLTRERNPDFTHQQFLKQFPDSHIEIPAERVLELYGGKAEDIAPDDGKLGFVPNLTEQLIATAQTGGRVQIPRNLYLAKVDPDIAKELQDSIAFRPGAPTKEEAAEAPKTEPHVSISSGAPEVDALRVVAHLHDPMSSPLFKEAGLGFENIIPEDAKPAEFVTAGGKRTSQATFPLRDILPKLPRDDMSDSSKVLSDFMGTQLDRLVGHIPVHIVTHDDMLKMHGADTGGTVLGHYDVDTHELVIRQDILDGTNPGFVGTHIVMHEAAHAVTSAALRRYPILAGYMKTLMNHTLEQLRKAGLQDQILEHANAFKNEREFVAEALSKTKFQELLHGVRVPDQIARGLRITKANSMWDAVRAIVKELWSKTFGGVPSETVMDAVFRSMESFEELNPKAVKSISGKDMIDRMEEGANPEEKEAFEAKALGMSVKTYRNMRELAMERAQKDIEYVAEKQQKEEKARESAEWKSNSKVVRDSVKDDLLHRPDIAADNFLRTGELYGVKYRRQRLDENALSPWQKAMLSEEHYSKNGMRPDDLANVTGFQSGDDMIHALAALHKIRETEGLTPAAHFEQTLNALTDREMRARFGDPASLVDAKDHVLNATQYEILHEDTLRYAEKAGDELTLKKEHFQSYAKEELATKIAGGVNSTQMMQRVGDLGRKIEAAAADQDWAEAFRLSQQRQIAFLAAKEGIKFERRMDKLVSFAKRFKQREPKSVPIAWSNAIQDILQRVGFSLNRTSEDIAREYEETGGGSLRAFVDGELLGTQKILDVDPDFPQINQPTLTVAQWLQDPDPRTGQPFSKDLRKAMTVEEATQVMDSLESLYEHGKAEGKAFLDGEWVDKTKLINDLVDIMHEVFRTDEKGPKKITDKDNQLKVLWTGLLQMETLWTRLAQGDRTNPFMTKINRPLMSAGNEIDSLQRQYSREYGQIGKFPGDMNKTVSNHLFFEPNERGGEIPDTPRTMTVRNMLAVLQNVGNWSNHDKLVRGYGMENRIAETWRKQGYQMEMNDPVMNWLFQHTTKEDWDRAQKLGDIFAKLFDHSEQVYYELGQRPGARIELRPIETPFGTYKGWYHPVIYDSNRPAMFTRDPETGEEKKVGGSAKLKGPDPMDSGYYASPKPPAGYQQARTGYAAPIKLTFDAIPYRLKQMINDIAMRPVVTQIDKIFSDDKFTTAMRHTYGQEYAGLLRPYLKDIAGQRRYVDPMQAVMNNVFEYFYQNTVATLIGFNPGTVLKHFPTALMNSVNEVGAADFYKEFANTWLNPMGWANAKYALEKSAEIARRSRNWRETITGAQEDLFQEGTTPLFTKLVGEKAAHALDTFRRNMIKAGATPVAWSDLASVVPMWNLVYKREIRAGTSEGEAIDAADQAVRRAHGSTAITARPAIMRNSNPFVRATAPFYTFFNDMLQRQYETGWRAKDAIGYRKDGDFEKGNKEIGKVALGIWAYVLFPAIVEQAISPIQFKKDDNYIKMGIETIGRDVASSWPIVRDFVNGYLGGRDPTVSIYDTGAKSINDFARDISNGSLGLSRQRRGKLIKHTATMIGTTLGVANAQMGRWGQFAHDYATGVQRPRTGGDWYRAFRFGDIKEPKR